MLRYLVFSSGGTRRKISSFLVNQRFYSPLIPPVESLTRSYESPTFSDNYVEVDETNVVGHGDSSGFFPVKNGEQGLFERGVSPEAKEFLAEVEEEYKASSKYLNQTPTSLPETSTYIDEGTGLLTQRTQIMAPVGETYVPSSKERFALRGHVGELNYQRETIKKYLKDEKGQLNLKKERQLQELLSSPMRPLLKAAEVTRLLEQFYVQKLSLQRDTAENVMLFLSSVSLQMRLEGKLNLLALEEGTKKEAKALLCNTLQDVPLFDEMNKLYQHLKSSFIAPTPLILEHMMMTVAAVQEPDKRAFHLANRLFLDSDKYVVLPTRTTYTAFFDVCRVNDAMKIAIVRWRDAVKFLHIQTDAPMLTSLIKGLNESGYVEEAVMLLGKISEVPLTTPLLNTTLETLLLTEDPLACFSIYESVVKEARLKPTAETYTLLLLACEKSGYWDNVTIILADMQSRRIKGNSQTLNLLLKGLLRQNLRSYASQLYLTMCKKKVPIWPALDKAMQQQRLKE